MRFLQYERGHYPQPEWERCRKFIQRILATNAVARAEVDSLKGWGFTAEFERALERIPAQH
jgi:hypothetical protein